MSRQQPPRNQTQEQEPMKYGDVFPLLGDLACQPVAPQDASMMQTAENLVLGQTQKGGSAPIMQSAAARNERIGAVSHTDITDSAAEQGMTVVETDVPGQRIIFESVAGQVVRRCAQPAPLTMTSPASALESDAITIGQASEASALTDGDKPVDQSDAAAIQAAEVRAAGRNVVTPRGIAASARSAATLNVRTMRDEDETKLADVLTDATMKLPADKAATRQDAGVIGAELRNNPSLATHPGGVAACVAAAARLNQNK
ncbi:late embryogenesis abundant protein D-34-like [Magnolia sinica]|uniref:late embryogenesis abundant protein D-34-like n=1 Tax=Magnolia sinica TaxID=86752 RepID=UPI00265AA42D|nr:late embryogenesis abundant protein D-34-like [Magnolia sinica]